MGIQLHQFLNLLVLLGIAWYNGTLLYPFAAIVGLMLWSWVWERCFAALRGGYGGSVSALSTAVGVILMLYVSRFWIAPAVLWGALAQKHFLRPGGRHLFNPSNFAVIAALWLFPTSAAVVSAQLGSALVAAVLVSVLAMGILIRAKRWIVPPVFVLVYLLGAHLLLAGYDPTLTDEEILRRFASIAFLVFVFFMLTDPRTTPESPWGQALFAAAVALAAVGLDRLVGIRTQHPFEALFLISPIAAWGRMGTKGERIAWALGIVGALGIVWSIERHPPLYLGFPTV